MNNINNLGDLRESKGYKQSFICDKMGISRQSMSKKEKRMTFVSTSEAYMLADLYGEDIETIEKLCKQR